jgi:hypothetical protein
MRNTANMSPSQNEGIHEMPDRIFNYLYDKLKAMFPDGREITNALNHLLRHENQHLRMLAMLPWDEKVSDGHCTELKASLEHFNSVTGFPSEW